MHKGSLFSTSSPALVISCLFDDSHADRCEVISYCGFGLHFPDDKECRAPLHLLCDFYGEMYSDPLTAFEADCLGGFLVHCMSSSYNLDIDP